MSSSFRLLLIIVLVLHAKFRAAGQDTAFFVVRNITITGNKTTKPFIIDRELAFKSGDTIDAGKFNEVIERSRQNLLNTSLFNFVTMTPLCLLDSSGTGCVTVDIEIVVKERWYTWPVPVFEVVEPNFNTWWRNGRNLRRANYGMFLTRYNFRGRKEVIAAIARFGYSPQYGFQYAVPYLNKARTLGITVTTTYTQNHEVAYNTENNKLRFFRLEDDFVREEWQSSVAFTYRKGLYNKHQLDVRFADFRLHDTVASYTSEYLPDAGTRAAYFTLSYRFLRDLRDLKPYPLKGYFLEAEVTKHGLGILPEEKLDVFFITLGARYYRNVVGRFFTAGMIRLRVLPYGTPPYLHQRAFGFGPYVRGYEYYVIDGQNFVLGKVNFKYQLLKPTTIKFKFIPLEKFNTLHLALYVGTFFDVGYVEDRTSAFTDYNKLGDAWLGGAGIGFDVVTYYDMVGRIEYSVNRMMEHGLFIHFGAPF